MKKLILLLLLGMFMISFVSAFEFDNVKSYDSINKKMTIRNSFLGIPTDKVAELTLDTPLNYKVARGYRKVAEFTISSYDNYDDAFKVMEFYDRGDNNKEIDRVFDYKYLTSEVIDNYVSSCEDYDFKNGTTLINANCTREKSGTKIVEVWEDFNEKAQLPKGDITIGIFTDVQEGDVIEWIPTFFGIRIYEWATWVESLNTDIVAYWKFDEGSGILREDSVGAVYNISSVGGQMGLWTTNGKINDSHYQNGNTSMGLQSDIFMDINNDNVTVAGWYNLSECDFAVPFGTRINAGVEVMTLTTCKWRCTYNSGVLIEATAPVVLNEWNHVACTYSNTMNNVSMYINGVMNVSGVMANPIINASSFFNIGRRNTGGWEMNGSIDELGVWNRTLSASEVVNLYNGGTGLQYLGESIPAVTINLEFPANESKIANISSNFRASGEVGSPQNFTNLTFIIWNSTDLFNESLIDISPDSETFNETWRITNFTLDNFTWNVLACLHNGSCYNADDGNFTFEVNPISTLAETYQNETLEGSTEEFTINLSIISGQRLSTIDFIYNETSYAGTFTEYESQKYYVNRTHSIPLIDANTNVTFKWNVTLESGTSGLTSEHNQTILDFTIDDCTLNTIQIFNLTLVDEEDQSILDGNPDNTSIKVDFNFSNAENTGLSINFSHDYDEVNSALICVNSSVENSTFRVDALIEYSSLGRFVEFYNIQNFILNNETLSNNITLYNLNSSDGTEFKITYKDDNLDTVPGAIIQIQRKYIEEGQFKTIEIPMISSAGYTIGHLVRNDIIYTLIILKDGVILDTFENIVADCQNPAITECEININSFATAVEPRDYSTVGDFSTTLTFNRTSRVLSSTFVIISGVPSTVVLNATAFDGYGNISICSDTLTASGGTLTCIVPATFGNQTMYVEVTQDGDRKAFSYIPLHETPSDLYGASLVFIGILIILLFIGMGITDDPKIMGVMLIFGSIILIAMNVISSSGWIGRGATILWFIVSVIIVLIKSGERQ